MNISAVRRALRLHLLTARAGGARNYCKFDEYVMLRSFVLIRTAVTDHYSSALLLTLAMGWILSVTLGNYLNEQRW